MNPRLRPRATHAWRAGVRLAALAAIVSTSALTSASHSSGEASLLEVRVGLARPGGGYSVTVMPLEAYVAGVLAGEAARGSDPAALQALAITVRTFALANRGRHRADGFDMCDQTHCQVLRTSTAATARAAADTAGRVLLQGGMPASVYYTASCGGRTEIPSAVWPGAEDPPYLPSQRDDACGGAPMWTAELSASDLGRALRAGGFAGDHLRNLRVISRDRSGRVARIRVDGFVPEEISGQDLRVVVGRTLGWQHIKSTAFELERSGDRYRFDGHGSGHGVGLCVIGSAKLAADGESAGQILRRYFPGLEVGGISVPAESASAARGRPSPATPRPELRATPIATPSAAPSAVALTLPDDDEGERPTMAAIVERARLEMARALGAEPPRAVGVRVHPTTVSYESATGQPWFTSGAWARGEIHLLPLAVLRDRGMLERTIRREMVHAMADTELSARPAWVREGVALYFAGLDSSAARGKPARQAGTLRSSCPSDAELVRPVSSGALANALTRAAACFERQIARGKSWRDVK